MSGPGVISTASAVSADLLPAGVSAPPWHEFRRRRPRPPAARRGAGAAPVAPVAWCLPASARYRSPAGGHRVGHAVHSFLPLVGASSSAGGGGDADAHGPRVVACLTVRRAPGRPRFSRRERALVCVLHAEAGWVYRADVMLASPDGRALTPRQRETLQHLLAGQAEKQIAHQMGLSVNTIHHYIKALHRHFGVSSRSELLARWVGK